MIAPYDLATMVTYDPKLIADVFLELGERDGERLTPMKVQKLVYFAHGWTLALTGRPLIDEQVEAWRFGPVVPSLYHALKHYGSEAIPASRRISAQAVFGEGEPLPIGELDRKLVEKIWRVYGRFPAVELSEMTHASGSPWHTTWHNGGKDKKGTDIPDEEIRQYYRKKAGK